MPLNFGCLVDLIQICQGIEIAISYPSEGALKSALSLALAGTGPPEIRDQALAGRQHAEF